MVGMQYGNVMDCVSVEYCFCSGLQVWLDGFVIVGFHLSHVSFN